MRSKTSPSGQKRSFIEQARRAQVVAAAAEAVAAHGYAGASLSRIAQQAGISKSVISYHFTGKDELLEQVVMEFFTDAGQYMDVRLEREESAAGQIRTWVASQIDYFGQHRTRFLAVSDIVLNHRAADGSRPFLDLTDEEIAEISSILAQGQCAGEFRNFDPDDVATIISRCTEGVLSAWMADDRIDLTTQTQTLLDFIDHAIRAEQP